MMKLPKIAVIGTGFAGLSAVVRLKELGFTNILMLEARADVGGRVRMIDFGGSRFNIGPEWLHGQDSNMVYNLAKNKLGLKVKDSNDYKFYFNEPKNLSIDRREIVFKSILEDLQRSIDKHFMDENISTFENKSILDVLIDHQGEQECLNKFAEYWAFNFENGSFIDEYSALVYKLSSDIYQNVLPFSDFYFVESDGFSQLINFFVKEANLNENDIRFNDSVTKIYLKADQVEIVTKKGKRYLVDYCVCAVPLSVIANNFIRIYPDFDEDFYAFVKKLKFSTYARIFVELEKHVWTNEYDWLIDLSGDFRNDISLWQNRQNTRVLIGHVCSFNERISCNLKNNIDRSLINIIGNDYKGIRDCRVVTLEQCPYSFGAFPAATRDLNLVDLNNFQKLHQFNSLMFAGDSYSLEYFGTVQGAVKSGMEAADNISCQFKNN